MKAKTCLSEQALGLQIYKYESFATRYDLACGNSNDFFML
jgi:hypothetical protein